MLAAEAPKITDWMQAWGSLAGLVMSTAAVIFTGLLFRHEIRVRREEQRDGEAAQARLIVAHITGMQMPESGEVGPMAGVYWRIKNHSQAPIFDAIVSIDDWKENRWGEVIEGEASGLVACDPPLPFDAGPYDPREALVAVQFTDAAGLRWTRRMGESPERVMFPTGKRTGLKRWLPFLRRNSSEFDDDPPF